MRQTRSRSRRSSASSAHQAPALSPSGHSSLASSDGEIDKKETAPRRARRKRPDRTNQAGLSSHVQKQLLQDIERSGGIKSKFSLKNICDSKEDVYGLPVSAQRRSVQNKVEIWKNLPREEYNLLLATLRVQPHAVLQATQEDSSPISNQPSRASFLSVASSEESSSTTTEDSVESEPSFLRSHTSPSFRSPTRKSPLVVVGSMDRYDRTDDDVGCK